MTDQRIYQIGLTMINGVGNILAHHLLDAFGDPERIFEERQSALEKIPGIGSNLACEIKRPEVLARAERELEFILDKRIRTYFWTDKDYPYRLKACADAPILLYFKGEANLDVKRIVSVVGTRRATPYGQTLTENFIKDLATCCPDTLIISGLAYGIDAAAHQAALRHQLPTVAVLAHGLDRIYPPTHRSLAAEMTRQGGLLTDYPIGTNPDRQNFVQRNRIVAGLADATVIIESAEKGGSMITADLAFSYGRELFAFPGRIDDNSSRGCNRLIQKQKASLITQAADLVDLLGWDKTTPAPQPTQGSLPFSANPENDTTLRAIQESGEIQVNELGRQLDIPFHQLSSILFELEMEGLIQALPGGRYKSLT